MSGIESVHLLHEGEDAEQQGMYEQALPSLRPLEDGYCAVYRPSLTDSKIRSGSRSLIEQYKLTPLSHPKLRPWLGRDTASHLHLKHQQWQKEQGWLCFQQPDDPACKNSESRLPRLGVQIVIPEVESVEPAKHRWSGRICLVLKVSAKETLGLGEQDLVDAATVHSAWPHQVCFATGTESATQVDFLRDAFGVRFYNLIQRDRDCDYAPEITGPKSFEELTRGEGVVVGKWTLDGMFYCPVDLSKFPYDVCSWDVLLTIVGWSPGLRYDWSSLQNLPEFEIFGLHGLARASDDKWYPYVCEQNIIPNLARKCESVVYCRFHSRRKPNSVLMNIVLPIFIVTLLSTVAVMQASGVNINEVTFSSADPLSFISTSLLTVVAMKFAYAELLPSGLGQPTLLDIYILACILLLAGVSILVVTCSVEDLQDFSAGPTYFCFVVLIHIAFFLTGYWHSRLPKAPERELLYPLPHDTENPDFIAWRQWRIGFSDASTECRRVFMCLEG